MMGSDENRGMSRRLGVEDWEWSSIGRALSVWMIERSGDTLCGLHHARGDEELGFLSLASKSRSTSFLVWASKLIAVVW
jgi:hypothetical protein